MPSIRPAKPKMKPELIAARVERPIASCGLFEVDPGDPGRAFDQGAERGREAGADRAAEVLAVGGDRVDVDAGAEVDRDAGLAEAVVGGDRVDEAVGAHLERVLDPDRHPGLQPGADRQALAPPGSARSAPRTGSRAAARPRRRRRRRSGRTTSRRGEKRPAIRSASSSPVAPDRVWKRQCSASSLAVEGAEVGLGVADVDREEHRFSIISYRPWVGARMTMDGVEEAQSATRSRTWPRRWASARSRKRASRASRSAASGSGSPSSTSSPASAAASAHVHKEDEEVYVVVAGAGWMQGRRRDDRAAGDGRDPGRAVGVARLRSGPRRARSCSPSAPTTRTTPSWCRTSGTD